MDLRTPRYTGSKLGLPAEGERDYFPQSIVSSQPTDWMDKANCVGVDMLPEVHGGQDMLKVDALVDAHCRRCPVQFDCLEFGAANDHANIGGIWGGVYFQRPTKKRRDAIDEQRKNLKVGITR